MLFVYYPHVCLLVSTFTQKATKQISNKRTMYVREEPVNCRCGSRDFLFCTFNSVRSFFKILIDFSANNSWILTVCANLLQVQVKSGFSECQWFVWRLLAQEYHLTLNGAVVLCYLAQSYHHLISMKLITSNSFLLLIDFVFLQDYAVSHGAGASGAALEELLQHGGTRPHHHRLQWTGTESSQSTVLLFMCFVACTVKTSSHLLCFSPAVVMETTQSLWWLCFDNDDAHWRCGFIFSLRAGDSCGSRHVRGFFDIWKKLFWNQGWTCCFLEVKGQRDLTKQLKKPYANSENISSKCLVG